MNHNSSKSYSMLISSMLIFGTIGIFRRYIPLSSGLLACARGILGACFLILFVKLRGGKIRHGIGAKKFWLLALTGGLMGLNWVFLFEAYNHTTVAIATLCYYMQPTIVILLSPLVFREKLTAKKLVCVLLSLLGMVLVSGITAGGDSKNAGPLQVTGVSFGLVAALLYACVVMLNKKVTIEDSYEKTILQLAAAAIVLLPYLLVTEDFSTIALSPLSLVMVLIVGLVHTGLAYALYFGSMPGLKAQSIALLSYIDPVFALILSAALLHESMTGTAFLGAVLIIGAALLSELDFKKKP